MEETIYKNAYIYLITVVEKTSSKYGMKYVGKCNGNSKSYITGGIIIKRIIKKYGTGAIDKVILVKQQMTDKQMNELEIFYINYYDTYNNGLNLTLGGDGMSGNKPSDETRLKMRNYRLGKKHSELSRRKMSKIKTGKIFSDETKDKISKANKGKIISVETRQKISIAGKGKIISDESIKKSNYTKQNWSEEKKNLISNKLSIACKGTKTDKTLYSFKHKNGTVEENITKYDFYNKYNFINSCIYALCKGKRKSYKGWSLL